MGSFLDKPKTEKHNETGSGNGLCYGLGSMQGWRVEMEDAHTAIIGLPHGLSDWSFFAVFDGHAGARASAYCAERLLDAITSNEDFKPLATAENSPDKDSVSKGIRTGFLRLDEQMRCMPEMKNGEDKSGSTAVGVMISPRQLFFVNCGDSRALISSAGKVSFSTLDHKPVNPEEKERIQNAGGTVMIQRVNGSLAVSRALGDFEYKNVQGKGPCEQLVSPEPEVFALDRSKEDEFIVLACDGIWDVMKNEEICDYVRHRMQITDNLEQICNNVIDTCLYKGSRDNMSIVIISFENAPKVSAGAQQKEKEADEKLESRIKEIVEQQGGTSALQIATVMHLLAVEDLEGLLPPGGGLYAKQGTIEQILTKLSEYG